MITVLSQAELLKLGAELATVASAPMAAGATAGLGGLATVAPVLGSLLLWLPGTVEFLFPFLQYRDGMKPRRSSLVLTDPSHVNSIYPFCTSMSLKEDGDGVFVCLIITKLFVEQPQLHWLS